MGTVCQACMHHCKLESGEWGMCGARRNERNSIVCKNYGSITSLTLEPIEKKLLKMFCPKNKILSVGSFGCNLRCAFCQNHDAAIIKKTSAQAYHLSPQELTKQVVHNKEKGNIGLAFSFNEPLTGWEFVRDTAKLVQGRGMKTILDTNGCFSLDILNNVLPFIDAMNIDLKGFRPEYYANLGGDLEMVKKFIARASRHCHVELTTMIVPNENDSVAEMEEEAKWIASIRNDIPLHITRLIPRYNMRDKQMTDVMTIFRLSEAAKKHLKHVFRES